MDRRGRRSGRDVKVRESHLHQLRLTIQDLWGHAGPGTRPGTIPVFSGGNIVAGARVINKSDPTDLTMTRDSRKDA